MVFWTWGRATASAQEEMHLFQDLFVHPVSKWPAIWHRRQLEPEATTTVTLHDRFPFFCCRKTKLTILIRTDCGHPAGSTRPHRANSAKTRRTWAKSSNFQWVVPLMQLMTWSSREKSGRGRWGGGCLLLRCWMRTEIWWMSISDRRHTSTRSCSAVKKIILFFIQTEKRAEMGWGRKEEADSRNRASWSWEQQTNKGGLLAGLGVCFPPSSFFVNSPFFRNQMKSESKRWTHLVDNVWQLIKAGRVRRRLFYKSTSAMKILQRSTVFGKGAHSLQRMIRPFHCRRRSSGLGICFWGEVFLTIFFLEKEKKMDLGNLHRRLIFPSSCGEIKFYSGTRIFISILKNLY